MVSEVALEGASKRMETGIEMIPHKLFCIGVGCGVQCGLYLCVCCTFSVEQRLLKMR